MKQIDYTMTQAVALPAAGSAASTAAVDLGGKNVGPVGAALEVHLVTPALPALVDAKTVTLEITHCDTLGGAYVPVPGVGNMILTGAGGAGVAASRFRLYLPPDTQRYIKARATVLAAGGDNTAKSLSMEFHT